LSELADKHNGVLDGLDHNVKSRDSLARKLKAEFDQLTLKGTTMTMDQIDVSDALRYTMIIPEDDYTRDLMKVLDDLRSDNYEVSRIKNYWFEGNGYKGVNSVVEDSRGQIFELQFHTPESIATKEKGHTLYNISRGTKDMKEKVRLEADQRGLWGFVPTPPGTDQIGVIVDN